MVGGTAVVRSFERSCSYTHQNSGVDRGCAHRQGRRRVILDLAAQRLCSPTASSSILAREVCLGLLDVACNLADLLHGGGWDSQLTVAMGEASFPGPFALLSS